MGIGPFRWDGRRARCGGIALGVLTAAFVVGGGAPPLALALWAGATARATGTGTVTRTESHHARASHRTAATKAARADRADAHRVTVSTLRGRAVAVASDRTGDGYWVVASDGSLFAAGNAALRGSARGRSLAAHVVGLVGDPKTGGYWEVAADGGIFSFGAPYYGSMGGHRLAAPIVGMSPTPNGKGYWEVAADGGIFSFGDARFYGSMGGHRLAAPIVGMATMPGGKGYWEVARDGGIFSFGHARFYGSMGGRHLTSAIVGMAAMPDGNGYWEVAKDGGIFSFGHARFYGSMNEKSLRSPITGLATTPRGKGYWEVAADGHIYSFGRARDAGTAKVTSSDDPEPAPSSPTAKPAPTATVVDEPGTPPPSPTAKPAPTATVVDDPSTPPPNPAANVVPVPAYTFVKDGNYSDTTSLPCWQLGTDRWIPELGSQCVTAEVAATDHARAEEGLPPMSLPSDYSSLTPEEQLFVLTDIERVSRGEQPAVGLSSVLDGDAQIGAETGDDPQFSFSSIASSNWWGSNVVSGALNALDANYTWMYDDGYGGYNVDCTTPSSSGCWGHRDNELTSNFGGTIVLGAGDATLRTGLQSLSELLVVVQDPSDLPPLYYTWAEAVAAGAAG